MTPKEAETLLLMMKKSGAYQGRWFNIDPNGEPNGFTIRLIMLARDNERAVKIAAETEKLKAFAKEVLDRDLQDNEMNIVCNTIPDSGKSPLRR